MEGSVLARIAAIVFVAIAITAAVVEMGRDEAGQADIAAGAWHEAEIDLRQAHFRTGRGDAGVAAHR